MKYYSNLFFGSLLFLLLSMASCGLSTKGNKDAAVADSDSIREEMEANTPLPTDPQPSVDELKYKITVYDTIHSGKLDNIKNAYKNTPGIFAFRGNPMRNADYYGKVKGTPKEIVKVWTFETKYDSRKTSMGTWGGGTGWTGQPVYAKWPKDILAKFKKESPALTADFGEEEIIVGSLCGKIYFINFNTGKASREPLDVVNPVKGSVSLDPTLNGNLYVGQGVPAVPPTSQLATNIFSHEVTFTSGRDNTSPVGWSGNDSSPVRAGQFLFWPCENGMLYKYLITGNTMTKHSSMHFTMKGKPAAGTENSICIYKNYGFYGTNNGAVICFDLNTLKPIWCYDNKDDIDASIVCEVENGTPYLYCGCEVDRQGNSGICHMVKLNGLNGKLVWEREINCTKLNIGDKHYDGGLYSTPLLGTGDCKDLIFGSICQPNGKHGSSDFMAFSKKTGEIVYSTPLKYFAWASPVGFLNEKGQMFIFVTDSSGYAYLIEAKTGKILCCERFAGAIESSPVVIGNQLVVGRRGTEVMKLEIR